MSDSDWMLSEMTISSRQDWWIARIKDLAARGHLDEKLIKEAQTIVSESANFGWERGQIREIAMWGRWDLFAMLSPDFQEAPTIRPPKLVDLLQICAIDIDEYRDYVKFINHSMNFNRQFGGADRT